MLRIWLRKLASLPRFTAAAFFLTVLGSTAVGAQTAPDYYSLQYWKHSGLGLGAGIVGLAVTQPQNTCFTIHKDTRKDSSSQARVTVVFTDDQYEKALHIDENAHASFMSLAGGSEDFHLSNTHSQRETRFDIVIEQSSVLGSDYIDKAVEWANADLAAQAASKDPNVREALRRRCGERYITEVFNEARLFVVLHVSSSSSSTLSNLKAQLEGHAGIGFFGGGAEIGLDQAVKSSHQQNALTLDVFQEGYDDFDQSVVAGLINNQMGVVDIQAALRGLLKNNKPTGHPVAYKLANTPTFSFSPIGAESVHGRISTLLPLKQNLDARLENLRGLASGNDSRAVLISNYEELRPQYDQLEKSLTAAKIRLDHALEDCFYTSTPESCENSSKVTPPPARSQLELPINFVSPWIGFRIFIDGVPVLPAQASALFRTGEPSLYSAATRLRGDDVQMSTSSRLSQPHFLLPSLIR